MTDPGLISLAELRTRLDAQNLQVSDSQLKRLRTNGLLECGGQVHLPGKHGSTSLYPASAPHQVELVERISRKERRFRQLRVVVRWHGGWVEPGKLRESLIGMVEGFSREVRALADGPGDDLAAVDRVACALISKPGNSKAQRLIRQRLGGENLDRIAFAFAALGLGAEIEWDNHDPAAKEPSLREVLERASGIERARQDSLAGRPALLLPDSSTESVLTELQANGSFDARDIARPLREAEDAAIDQGFQDVRVLAGFAPIAQAEQVLHGDDVAGLGSLEALIDSEYDAVGITLLVRQAILIRPVVPTERWQAITESVKQAQPKASALIELHRAFPEYSELLKGDIETKLAALPTAERERLHARVRNFVAQRPDIAATFDETSVRSSP